MIGAQVILAVLVYLSLRSWRGAWRAWLFLFLFFLANALMSGAPRIGQFGTGVAYEQRYFIDLAWLLALSLALALLPLRSPSSANSASIVRRPFPLGAPLVAVIVVLALGAHSLVASRSANQVLDEWPGAASKTYFQHLNAGLDVLEKRDGTPNLVDYALPEYVVGSWLVPYDWASNALATLQRPLVFDDYSRSLWIPDDSGQLSRATFQSVFGGSVSTLAHDHSLVAKGAVREDSSYCVAPKRRGSFVLTPSQTISGPRYFVRLESSGTASVETEIFLPSDAILPPDAVKHGRFAVKEMPPLALERSGQSTRVLDTQTVTSLRLVVNSESRFCISSLTVGTFIPSSAPVGG